MTSLVSLGMLVVALTSCGACMGADYDYPAHSQYNFSSAYSYRLRVFYHDGMNVAELTDPPDTNALPYTGPVEVVEGEVWRWDRGYHRIFGLPNGVHVYGVVENSLNGTQWYEVDSFDYNLVQ